MKSTVIASSALFLAAGALAQPGAGGPGAAGGMPANEVIFANNDANGDGEITRAEADAAGLPLSQNWATFDLNSDGKVTAEELDTARGQLAGGGRGGPGAGAPPAAPAADQADAGDSEDTEEDDDADD